MVRARREALWESWRLRGECATPRPGWHRQALCARADVEFAASAAYDCLDLCNRCPVRLDCLADAITEEAQTPVRHRTGIRGGLPASHRTTPADVAYNTAECDTRSGYNKHRRNGEEACDPCKAAHARHEQDQRRRRRLERSAA
jgi:hypothetical protein